MEVDRYHPWWKDQQLLPEGELPKKLQVLLETEDPALIKEMCTYVAQLHLNHLYENEAFSYAFLWNLYLHPSPLAKEALVKLLSRHRYKEFVGWVTSYRYIYFPSGDKFTFLPLSRKYGNVQGSLCFVKAIYKLAEARQDEEIWSLLAYRFDIGKNHHYSKKTRYYLRRRAWRYLRRLGEQGSSAYVRLATKVLLRYEETDGRQKRGAVQSASGISRVRIYRSFTHLWLFNHLLYHHSSRFTDPSSRYWQDQGIDSYPIIPPEKREEAFPELWDQHPEQLFLLLTKAKAEPVLQFAGRALRMRHPHFVKQKILKDLLRAKRPAQRAFAAGSMLDRSNFQQPDWELLHSFLFSYFPEVRAEAKRFIFKHHAQWEQKQIQQLLEMCLQSMEEKLVNPPMLHDLLDLYRGPFKKSMAQLATIDLARQFLSFPDESIQKFSADVLRTIDFDRHPFSGRDLLSFLVSTHSEVREAAQARIKEDFHRLHLDAKWFLEYIGNADEASYPFIRHFFQQYRLEWLPILPQLISEFWQYLLAEEGSEQVRNFLIDDLLGDLFFDELIQTPVSTILFLLEHESTHVQAFATRLMNEIELDPQRLSFEPLLAMAHHRVAAVRAQARRMIMEVEERMTADWVVNLIETDWADTREWMFDYVRNLPASSITPELIYGLLDTARSDVQAFAKELVQRCKATLNVKELMLRGSEHPDLSVQEYVLTLAEQIEWDVETLEQMELFFRIILFRVHQGRKLKKKALSLLLKLSEQNLSFAKICVPILADCVRNHGINDFETILVALTRIQMRYPEYATPITIDES